MKSWQERILLSEHLVNKYCGGSLSRQFMSPDAAGGPLFYSLTMVGEMADPNKANELEAQGYIELNARCANPTLYVGYTPQPVTTRTLFKILMGV